MARGRGLLSRKTPPELKLRRGGSRKDDGEGERKRKRKGRTLHMLARNALARSRPGHIEEGTPMGLVIARNEAQRGGRSWASGNHRRDADGAHLAHAKAQMGRMGRMGQT